LAYPDKPTARKYSRYSVGGSDFKHGTRSLSESRLRDRGKDRRFDCLITIGRDTRNTVEPRIDRLTQEFRRTGSNRQQRRGIRSGMQELPNAPRGRQILQLTDQGKLSRERVERRRPQRRRGIGAIFNRFDDGGKPNQTWAGGSAGRVRAVMSGAEAGGERETV
jgi:hypothetical protein